MFKDPSWAIGLDNLPELAIATRKRVFAEAAAKRKRVYGFHLPWPGIGQIVKQGGGYAWVPERIWWEPALGE